MMQDDENLDEFDIDDEFDAIEDEFDMNDDIDEEPAPNAEQMSSKKDDSPQKKTFVQQFFLPIVIGVIAVLAIIFTASLGLFSQEQPAQTITNDAMIASNEQSPPDGNTALPNEPVQEIPSFAQADTTEPLRPLLDQEATNDIELADLEAELQLAPENEPPQPDFFDSGIISDNENQLLVAEPELPLDSGSQVSDLMGELQSIEDTPSENSPIEVSNILQDIPAPEEVNEDVNSEAIINATQINVQNSADTKVLENMKSENKALLEENNSLSLKIAEKDEMIESLNIKISQLEDKQTQLVNSQSEMAHKSENDKIQMAPKDQSVEPVVEKTIQWVLRSAQPGMATLSETGSKDLKTVEIGTVLTGLGRIVTIQIENGLWVVRGTKGSVSQ